MIIINALLKPLVKKIVESRIAHFVLSMFSGSFAMVKLSKVA